MVSILARLLSMQVNEATVAYKPQIADPEIADRRGIVLISDETTEVLQNGIWIPSAQGVTVPELQFFPDHFKKNRRKLKIDAELTAI